MSDADPERMFTNKRLEGILFPDGSEEPKKAQSLDFETVLAYHREESIQGKLELSLECYQPCIYL